MNKEIAFFDFDGTITSKDTMLVFLRFLAGDIRYTFNMLLLTPVFVGLKSGLLSNQRAKEIMLKLFLGGTKESDLDAACLQFSRDVLPDIIRAKAIDCIRDHQHRGAEVVVVSAAPEYWVRSWCAQQGISLLATRLAVLDGRITGKIDGLNCHGEEKVRRIKEVYQLNQFNTVYAYGDTSGDKPMLALATHASYKPFR
jgi:phosphatidylglycerophosphatase C